MNNTEIVVDAGLWNDLVGSVKRCRQGLLNLVEFRLVPTSFFAGCLQEATELQEVIDKTERNAVKYL